MKKLVCVLSLLLVLSLVFEVVAEEPHKTEFDRYTYGSYITVTDPYYKMTQTLQEISASNDSALTFIAQAWCNLLLYEVNVEGKAVKDTTAAKIYNGMKKKLCVEVLTASDPEAIFANVFFANTDQQFSYVYWIEWNLEDQVLRCRDGVSDGHKSTDALLSDYMLSSWANATIQDPSDYFGFSKKEKKYILFKFAGTSNTLLSAFDKAYSDANSGKKNPLR